MSKAKKKKSAKKLSKFEKMTKGKVLVPKVGHEIQFVEALQKAHQIGHGALGWQGQAEMMVELGMVEILKKEGVKFPKSKEGQITKMRHVVIGMFMDNIYQHGDWVTKKEAKKRQNSQTILFDKPEEVK